MHKQTSCASLLSLAGWIPACLLIWLTHPCPFRVPVRFPHERQPSSKQHGMSVGVVADGDTSGRRRPLPLFFSENRIGCHRSSRCPSARPHSLGQPERASRVHARLDPCLALLNVLVGAARWTSAGSAPRCSSDASSLYREDSAIFLPKWRSSAAPDYRSMSLSEMLTIR
jgi:hypothetical protein